MEKSIGIIGQGFVGNAIYQKFKNYFDVLTYDLDKAKSNSTKENLIFKCNTIFLCLPTPMNADGSCNVDILQTELENIDLITDNQEITNLYFPFFKNLIINLGWFFIPFSVFVIVGSSNAVNLTDGLDGLATVPVILVAACFAFISYVTGNIVFSDYLHIPYIEGAGEVTIFCGAIIGSCLGFLWFNAPPAKIFMGDTGSLALGGSLGSIGIITKHEIVLAITGGLFVFEAISVIVQVLSFKITGKRIFKMAPVHHHFEKKGWPESTVVIRFWIISIILAMIGLATLKLR